MELCVLNNTAPSPPLPNPEPQGLRHITVLFCLSTSSSLKGPCPAERPWGWFQLFWLWSQTHPDPGLTANGIARITGPTPYLGAGGGPGTDMSRTGLFPKTKGAGPIHDIPPDGTPHPYVHSFPVCALSKCRTCRIRMSACMKKSRELVCPFHQVRTQGKEGYLWTKTPLPARRFHGQVLLFFSL